MTFMHEIVEVTDEPTSLLGTVADTSGNNYDVARSILVTNIGEEPIHVGGADVSVESYGKELLPGDELEFDLGPTDVPYAVAATGPVEVTVLHMGV